jgi:chromate transporter
VSGAATVAVGLAEATRVWLRIGLLSFGGPAGQIALMHRVVVDERRWIADARFVHALNFCMLLPGPEAMQLATYVGWLLHGTRGGLIAGVLFVLPGAAVMLALAWLYAAYGQTALVAALFFGVKAAVLAIVVEALLRIGRRVLKNRTMVGLAAAAFVAMFALGAPFPLVVLGAGLVGLIGGRVDPGRFAVLGGGAAEEIEERAVAAPTVGAALRTLAVWLGLWFAPLALLALAGGGLFLEIGLFFSKLAVVTFGGAYAVLAYVAQEAVQTQGWLAPGQMLDGLGLAETTPGPLILVLQFVGFLAAWRGASGLDPALAGVFGAALTLWVTFVPCFLWIFLAAPFVERARGRPELTAALSAITAAVVGVILNLAIWFGLHVLFGRVLDLRLGPLDLPHPDLATLDPAALVLSLVAAIGLFRFHLGLLPVLGLCAGLGLLWRLAVG